jgi:hypothetical protein
VAFAIDRDEDGKPVCLYVFPPYDMGTLVNIKQAEAIRLAAEYREHMFQVGLKRGLTPAEAQRFAAEQVETQLILRMKQQQDEILKRKKWK